MHGCVQAVLRVDAQVPDELRHGVFAEPGREYRAWVRFSNALGIEHDLKFINRGMAIKLLDVKGDDRLLPNELPFMLETGTQDFVLSTGDVFVIPDTRSVRLRRSSRQAARVSFIALMKVFVKRRLWRGLAALVRGGTVLAPNSAGHSVFQPDAVPTRPQPDRQASRASVPDAGSCAIVARRASNSD